MSEPTSPLSRARGLLPKALLVLALALTAVWFLSPWYAFSVGRTSAQPLRSPFSHNRLWWVGWTDARLIRLHIASATGIGSAQSGPTSDWEVKFLRRRHSTSWTHQLPWKRQLRFTLDTHPEPGSVDDTRFIVEFPALLLVLLAWVAVVRANQRWKRGRNSVDSRSEAASAAMSSD